MLGVLRVSSFRYLFLGSALWWFALWMEFLGVGWIALELTDSPFYVGLVGFFRMIPLLLAGLFSGFIIDRIGRRRIVVFAQVLHFSVAVTMALLFFSENAEYWHIATAAFAFGTIWSIDFPARRSLIPDLVGKKMTADAVICEGFAMNAGRLFGPLAAGFVLQIAGALGCYILLCAVSLSSLIFLRRLPSGFIPRDAMPAADSPWKHLRDGLTYARRHRVILAVLLITMVANYLAFPYVALLPVFARDVFHQGPSGLGLIGMAAGLGALPGILIIYRMKKKIPEGVIYSVGTFGFCVALAVFAMSSSFSLSFLVLLIAGIGHACFGLMQTTLILGSASDEMRSRAMGLIVLAIGVGPIGTLQMGALASEFGAPFAVRVSALLGAILIIIIVVLLPQIWRAGKQLTS